MGVGLEGGPPKGDRPTSPVYSESSMEVRSAKPRRQRAFLNREQAWLWQEPSWDLGTVLKDLINSHIPASVSSNLCAKFTPTA